MNKEKNLKTSAYTLKNSAIALNEEVKSHKILIGDIENRAFANKNQLKKEDKEFDDAVDSFKGDVRTVIIVVLVISVVVIGYFVFDD